MAKIHACPREVKNHVFEAAHARERSKTTFLGPRTSAGGQKPRFWAKFVNGRYKNHVFEPRLLTGVIKTTFLGQDVKRRYKTHVFGVKC